jgi:hypothetical protein
MEDCLKKANAIMYGKPIEQKLDSKIQFNLSDRISKIIKPVCKAVAKIIRTPSHHEDLLKPKLHK